MSKMDDLRAMREARYAAARAGAATSSPKPSPAPAAKRASSAPAARTAELPADPGATAGLCGHRNMGGRTCTREQGHSAKSHRYS
jgi:hypothetical protein